MPWSATDVPERVPEGEAAPAIPAATVVVLRDGDGGLETLFLRRNSKLEFAGGMWVFPGGRLDPVDFESPAALAATTGIDASAPQHNDRFRAAAERAARREAREEADLELGDDPLIWFSHWTPPSISIKRFATWFFVGRAPPGLVTIDGGEIHDHAWMTPAEALRRRNALEIELAPPTWITLENLLGYATVDDALTALAQLEAEYFVTQFAMVEGGAVALYRGDAGLADLDPERPGARHRLWMLADGWRYERDPLTR